MDIILLPMGSAGDVHPFLAVGLELKRRGHAVTLRTSPYFEDLVRRAGVDFEPVGTVEDFEASIRDPRIWHPRKSLPFIFDKLFLQPMRPTYEYLRERHRPGETLVVAPANAFGARVAQEALGVPLVTLILQPTAVRSAHQMPVLPVFPVVARLPPWAKRLFYRAIDAGIADRLLAPEVNALRAEAGLATPVRRLMNIWWYSPEAAVALYPEWFAPRQPDAPAQLVQVGFPLYDEADVTPIDPALAAFLDDGTPPIAFAPGSANLHASKFFHAAADACRRLGRRGLLLSRFTEQIPADLPDAVRHVAYAPFSRVLPRCAALVHHGGIGTTAQALAAGIPQLIMPMAYDQHDNAARLMRLGVGAKLPAPKFQGPAVARELASLLGSSSVAASAIRLADRLVDRPAVALAADAILGVAAKHAGARLTSAAPRG